MESIPKPEIVAHAHSNRSPSHVKRIMVVDDEWIVARDLSNLIDRLGHIVVGVAGNATDALQITAAEKPDLILMDIHLQGGMDGAAAATEIVRRHAIPVIYITANSHVFLHGDVEMVAPYICIAKPFSESIVRAAIEGIVLDTGALEHKAVLG